MSTVILTPCKAWGKSTAIARHLAESACIHGPVKTLAVDQLDLNTVATSLVQRTPPTGTVAEYVDQTVGASILTVITPIYYNGLSGLTKLFLDLLPRHALQGSAVFGVGMAGSARLSGSLTYVLDPVLAALGASHVLPPVHVLPNDWMTSEHTGPVLLGPTRETLTNRVRTAHAHTHVNGMERAEA